MEIKGYKLADVIGDGRTGRVYRAERLTDGAIVAFRQVKPHLAAEAGVPEAVVKLATDCQGLKNVVVVPVSEAFIVEGAICVVEPFVEGRTLRDRLVDGPLPPEEVTTLGVEVLEALAELHGAGIVHSDVSPSNIMLTNRGARLMSLGVAGRTQRRRLARAMFGDPCDAPELQTSGNPTPSTDLFGLAACLDFAMRGDIKGGFSLAESDSDDPLRVIVDEGTAGHPNMRFKTANEFKRALLAVHLGASPKPEKKVTDEGKAKGDYGDVPPLVLAPAKKIPEWAPKAAVAAGIVVVVVLVISWGVSLLPDVPAGMVEIPASSLAVGDAEGSRDERPGFVWSHGRFFLDRNEVTVDQYESCVADGGCSAVGSRLDRRQDEPSEAVVGVTWLQANAYCGNQGKRLPSENEWEAAARQFGGRYPWGDTAPHCGLAWFGGWPTGPCGSAGVEPGPRKIFLDEGGSGAPQGLAGNVWEFTNSDYLPTRTSGTGESAPAGSSVLKVIKGGAFSTDASELRSAARLGVEMDHWAGDVGFRCAQTPGKP